MHLYFMASDFVLLWNSSVYKCVCLSVYFCFLCFSFGSFFSCLFCPVLTCLFWFYLILLYDYSLNAYFFSQKETEKYSGLNGREGGENIGGVLGGKL